MIKENTEKSIVIKSNREAIMQFGKVEMLIGRKGTLIVYLFMFFLLLILLALFGFSLPFFFSMFVFVVQFSLVIRVSPFDIVPSKTSVFPKSFRFILIPFDGRVFYSLFITSAWFSCFLHCYSVKRIRLYI